MNLLVNCFGVQGYSFSKKSNQRFPQLNGGKMVSALYPQKSMKRQLLNILSKVLNKFVSILFLKKIVS